MNTEESSRIPEVLKKNLSFMLETTGAEASKRTEAEINKIGITARHFYILCVLTENGPLNQQTIADLIRVNRNAMVQLIDQLEQLNLATRRVNPENRREHIVQVTDKGKSKCQEGTKILKNSFDDCLKQLNNNERKTLMELLMKIVCSGLFLAVANAAI